MVPSCQSGFLSLAADRVSAADVILTLSPKTRVGVSRHRASGRKSRQARSMFMPGSRRCVYKTASGRHGWPNSDPIGELGFETVKHVYSVRVARPDDPNLYRYVLNSPLDLFDPDGLDCSSDCKHQFKKDLIGCALGVGIGFTIAVVPCAIACVATGPGYAFCIGACVGYFGTPAIQAFLACAGVASAKEIACEAGCRCQ